MLPPFFGAPGDIRQFRFSFACSRWQTTRRQSEAPKNVPDHTSCRALSRHSLIDLFTGAPAPYYRICSPFSSSTGERKLMYHFVVKTQVLWLRLGRVRLFVSCVLVRFWFWLGQLGTSWPAEIFGRLRHSADGPCHHFCLLPFYFCLSSLIQAGTCQSLLACRQPTNRSFSTAG